MSKFIEGNVYTVVRCIYTVKTPDLFMGLLFNPEFHNFRRLECVNLTYLRSESKTDAYEQVNTFYFFEDEQKNTWYTSSFNTNSFTRHFDDGELLEIKDGEAVKGEDGLSIVKDKEKWAIFEDHYTRPFSKAEHYIYNMYRTAFSGFISRKYLEEWNLYMKEVFTEIEKASGKEIHLSPVRFKARRDSKDGLKLEDCVLPSFLEATLI